MIKVTYKAEAWTIASAMLKNPVLIKDREASKKTGYNIYRDEKHYYNYVCDLGTRLEVNKLDGSSTNIWMEKDSTESTNSDLNYKPSDAFLDKIAEKVAESLLKSCQK